jgi:hypothetical protein
MTTSYNPLPSSPPRSAKEREAFARTRARENAVMSPSSYPYPSHPASLMPHAGASSAYHTRGSLVIANDDASVNGVPPLPNPYSDPNGSGSPTSSRTPPPTSDPGSPQQDEFGSPRRRESRVLVHQDAGRVQVPESQAEDPENESEIPPTYDSIRHDPRPVSEEPEQVS